MISNFSSGTGINNLTNDHFNQTIFPYSEKVVVSFNNKIRSTYKKIGAVESENIELAELRDWLLPMLMNGQVTVQVETKEETKTSTPIINLSQQQNQRFELWLSNQGAAARGEIDKATLQEIFDAMEEDDK